MPLLVLLILALAPPLVVTRTGSATWIWIGDGAASWGVALAVKILLGGWIRWAAERVTASRTAKSALWGCWSGCCELGAAAAVFLWADPPATLGEAIGFGIGAGSIEVVYVLFLSGGGPLTWSPVIERALTSIGHVSSRGLVWIGLVHESTFPEIAIALLAFTAIDGAATYGELAGWNWGDPTLLRRFYAGLAVVTAIEGLAFVAFACWG